MTRKPKLLWSDYRRFLGRINHITHDWLTPVEYLPYIDALLGDIDLDPCSTHSANAEFLHAKKIYTLEDDGLNTTEPWTGKVYLFPPTYGRCSFKRERGTWRWSLKAGTAAKAPSVIWFQRLLREWKLRNVSEALFYTIYPEMMRICPEMWEYPVASQQIDQISFKGINYFACKLRFTGATLFTYHAWSLVLTKWIVLRKFFQILERLFASSERIAECVLRITRPSHKKPVLLP